MSMFNQIADLCEEAAKNLAALMQTAEAERLQVRHFLPDELEGSAIMLRAPIDMVLHCPKCGLQHIDAPDVRRRPDNSGADNARHLRFTLAQAAPDAVDQCHWPQQAHP
jgi:hypothetical protein